ncbi:MAG TPA: LysM peptidoglycan-binding domain-containing protein [Acidimicrobiales bacterium]|nr:LysM peptidoglycan-binding domain-containing protein [Acidimicrobiales bacterium]
MKRVSLTFLVALLLGTSCSGGEKNTVPTTTLGDLFENSSAPETVPPLRVEGWEIQELYPARNLAEECIASARPPDIVLPDEGPETVVVQSGDTLSGIAAEHDTTVDAFMRANGLSNPNSLRVGQVLLIPSRKRRGNRRNSWS